MNEQLMFERVRELCNVSAKAIDRISKECGINQNLVAKMYIKVFNKILSDIGGTE